MTCLLAKDTKCNTNNFAMQHLAGGGHGGVLQVVQNGSRERACDGAKQPRRLILLGSRRALDDAGETFSGRRIRPKLSLHFCLVAEVKEDKATAATWFEKAAREGHAQAMKNLGKMYAAGDGVPEDPEKSDYWFKKAGMGELYVKGKRARNF